MSSAEIKGPPDDVTPTTIFSPVECALCENFVNEPTFSDKTSHRVAASAPRKKIEKPGTGSPCDVTQAFRSHAPRSLEKSLGMTPAALYGF